jgi:hypothetical protein
MQLESRGCGTRRRRRRPRLSGQGLARRNRGQSTRDGLTKRGSRRGNGSTIDLRSCRGVTAFLTRHGDRPRGHITRQRSLAFCHIPGETLPRRFLRRQSLDGDCRFLLLLDPNLLDPNLARRRCERHADGRRGHSFPRLRRCRLLCCSPRWRSLDRRNRDQEPHFLKTCDFGIESSDNS